MFRKLDLAFRIKIYIFCVRGWGGVWANKGRLIILTVDVIYRLQSCAFPKEERKVSVDMLGNSSSVCRSTGRQWQVQLEPPPNQVVTLFNSKYFTNHLRVGMVLFHCWNDFSILLLLRQNVREWVWQMRQSRRNESVLLLRVIYLWGWGFVEKKEKNWRMFPGKISS